MVALQEALDDELSRQKSLSTTYGRITEQWFPLMQAYPYDPGGFRFLGTPVDGVQFEEDRIVFERRGNARRGDRRALPVGRPQRCGEAPKNRAKAGDHGSG